MKIIIIGAGPSGLTAAYELSKQGHEVIILEADNRIGGISKTVKYENNRMDIGGHRFFSKNEAVMSWWKNMLPYQGAPSKDDKILNRNCRVEEGGPDPEKDDNVFLIRHRISRIYFNGKFFDYPVSFKWQTFANMGLMTSMSAGFSYLKSCFHKLPEDSLENFYINRFGKKLYSMFFEGYTEKVWGRSPKLISADWGAQRVKGVSIALLIKEVFRKIFHLNRQNIETSLIEEFYYPKYGPGQLWEFVAEKIKENNGKIIFDSEVISIENSENTVNKVICSNGKSYDADIVISSMPLKDLIHSLHVKNNKAKDVANGLPYRDFITIGFLVDNLAIQNKTNIQTLGGIIPDCWIYVQDTSVKLGRIQIFNNWSPYMVENPENKVWLGLEYFCNENDELWNMSEKQFIAFAKKELAKIGIIQKDTEILLSHQEKVKKAYPAYFDTYKDIDVLINELNQYNNLYCIGRNGQHRYNNMDHSMLTAFKAVGAINGKVSKKEIWNVNTEKEYHESK